MTTTDRRKHSRIPILGGVVEPINLRFTNDAGVGAATVPAIITDLSEGGMSMVTFTEPPHAKVFEMDLNLPGLHHIPITARVLWVHTKGPTYAVGMTFTKIAKKDQQVLKQMIQDFQDCETRLGLNLPEACVPDCTFHRLCEKPQKAKHFPPKV